MQCIKIGDWCWYKEKYFVEILDVRQDYYLNFRSLDGVFSNYCDSIENFEIFDGNLPSFIDSKNGNFQSNSKPIENAYELEVGIEEIIIAYIKESRYVTKFEKIIKNNNNRFVFECYFHIRTLYFDIVFELRILKNSINRIFNESNFREIDLELISVADIDVHKVVQYRISLK